MSVKSGWGAVALAAAPIVCFTLLIVTYAVNVPWMDDIDAFLSFIIGYIDADTAAEKADWLLRPNNEHRILTAKLITLLLYTLSGQVNFRWLILAGYLFLLGIVWLFYRVFKGLNLPLLAFVPIPFFVLQPQYYLTSIWAITGLQHQVVVCLILTALYMLANGRPNRFAVATGLQLLASLSMSNGLFGWVAGAVVLALQRNWYRLGIWLVIGVATILFYFHDFHSPQGNESSFSFFIRQPYLIVAAFFTFTGGLFDFFPDADIVKRSILPTLAGLVLITTMLALLWNLLPNFLGPNTRYARSAGNGFKPDRQRQYFFVGCYAFLMVNASVVAFLRPRFGYSVMLVSNYMIYPALLISLLYLTVLSEYRRSEALNRWVRVGILSSIAIFSISYFIRWPKVAYRKQVLLTSAFNQKHNGTGLGPTWGTPFADLANHAMTEAVKRGIYQYPAAYYTAFESTLRPSVQSRIPDSLIHVNVSGGGYSYIAETVPPTTLSVNGPSAVVVQSPQRSYLYVSELPFGTKAFWLNQSPDNVRAEVVNSLLAPGSYRVGLFIPSAGQPVRFSSQTITIP
ncbi:hypothetical protein GCM10027577_38290 [Spirosoma fluminis]